MTQRDENSDKDRPKGIPDNHPSIGKHVRDPVEGPSWPAIKDHGGGRMLTRAHEMVWGILLAVWIIYSRFFFISPYFKDIDSARLAYGLGQKLQGVGFGDGDFYQLEKISGSYYLYELLARIFSVDIYGLPAFMAYVCAAFMVGILILNYSLGRMIWGPRVGLVSTTILSISPMMWITGQYATTLVPALFFFMLAVWAMVMCYRVQGGRWWGALSGVLFGLAIMIRLDMALGMLVPLCYAFFVDRRGLRRAFIIYGISLAVYLIGAGVLISHGYSFADILSAGPHSPDYPKSLLLNWWGMGPFLFVFAFAGFVYRFATDRKPLPFIFFWIVGFNTFYTGHLYSPSYFISYYPVVSWLAAFSIIALYGWLVKLVRFNRPARILFMILFACGGLSMLFMSTVKECDNPVRIKFADTISYTRDTGLHPTGSVWYYMQDFRDGIGFQNGWIENGSLRMAQELFTPGGPAFEYYTSAMYVGSESQIYLNYYLLASGWKFEALRGDFVSFVWENTSNNTEQAPYNIQTIYQGDEPVSSLGFLTTPPTQMNLFIGRDAFPHFTDIDGDTGAPNLLTMTGWHRKYSYLGLDVIVPGPVGGQDDGTLAVENELYRFFHTDLIPRYHIVLSMTQELHWAPDGEVISTDGTYSDEPVMMLMNASEIGFEIDTIPYRWLALAVNYDTLVQGYTISVNGNELESPEILARNIAGFGFNRWDIILIPPEHITGNRTSFLIDANTRGAIYDIFISQRTYPDCQYRNETARVLDLEFQDINCIR